MCTAILGSDSMLEKSLFPRAEGASFLSLNTYFSSIDGGTDQIQATLSPNVYRVSRKSLISGETCRFASYADDSREVIFTALCKAAAKDKGPYPPTCQNSNVVFWLRLLKGSAKCAS